MKTARNARPVTHDAVVGHRVRAAERMVQKWTSTYPPIPREARERLAAQLLADDPADAEDDQA
ncbi:MAG: hypothetical protein M3Q10_14760 [Chloroflexota bacterium]|nr:hypothetical protein [Chloroflexota bacterium]